MREEKRERLIAHFVLLSLLAPRCVILFIFLGEISMIC